MSQQVELEIDPAQWRRETALGGLDRRGRLLGRLDDAIDAYGGAPSDAHAFDVRQAFEDWKTEKQREGRWPSERDRTGAVSGLEAQLDSGGVSGAAWRERQYAADPSLRNADDTMMKESSQRLRTLFSNAEILFLGSANTTGASRTLASDYVIHPWEHIRSSIGGAMSSASKSAWDHVRRRFNIPEVPEEWREHGATALSWGKKLYGIADIAFGEQVETRLKGTALGTEIDNIITEAAKSIPPWLSHVWDAQGVAQQWAQIVVDSYHSYDVGNRDYDMADGDPIAAYSAMRSVMKHEIANAAGDATISTAAFATKLATAHADLGVFTGPTIGLVQAAASVAHKLAHLGFQYRAAKAMRLKLQEPTGLDVNVFRTYPLLGAYFIHCAELSALVPMANRYTPGWRERIERRRKETEYVYYGAKQLIDACPFKIVKVQKITNTFVRPGAHAVRNFAIDDLDALAGPTETMITTAVTAAVGA